MSHLRMLAVVLAVTILSAPAFADSYPVAGRWTYDYSPDKGPAKECGSRRMEFSGERRFDTVGGVRDYRNVSVAPAGASRYRAVDEIFTGQVRGHVDYTLRMIDSDHIELNFVTGTTTLLRRCA